MSGSRIVMPSFFSRKTGVNRNPNRKSTFFAGKRAEKTEVLSEELQSVEQRVDQLHSVLLKCKAKLCECLRTKPGQDNVDKRKKKLAENIFAQFMHKDIKELIDPSSLLGNVMIMYGQAYQGVVDELCLSEMEIEKKILDRFSRYAEDEANIAKLKAKLKTLTLDMDSAKSRLSSNNAEKANQTQQEFDDASQKVDSCKDQLATEMYILAAKEVEMTSMFAVLAQIQLEYHRAASSVWDKILPQIRERINSYSRRPVYGCQLPDHLRFANREIALVLEVCCAALLELGLEEEGLFRLSGVATKVRKIKASFDAGAIDLSDYDIDHHSITGALKSYLRELPDPLMTHNLYNEWKNAISGEGDSRISAIQAVIQKLPKPNYDNLRFLIKFLALVASHSDRNKMTASNIAIVMGPNLIWSPIDDGSMTGANIHAVLVECLVSRADLFFPGDISFKSDLITSLTNRTGGFLSTEAERFNDRKSPLEHTSYPNEGQSSPHQKSNYLGPVTSSPAGSVNNTLSRKTKQQAPPPPPSMSQSMNGSIMPDSFHKDYESDGETSHNVAGLLVKTNNRHCATAEDAESRETSPDLAEKHRADQTRPNPLSAPKPARRTVNMGGMVPSDPKHSSIEELSTIPGEENASSGTIKKSEDILVSTARLSESFASKGHRKTNSLDRPVKPPPAPPTFNDSSRTANEAISTLPEEPSSTGTDSISKGSSHPVRPPLPTKENLERNSVMRNSIGKGESSKDAETTSDEPQKAARHQGRKAPKADISEADSSENLYDEVMPDIPENASPPKNRLDSHTKGAEVVTRRSATDELREGEEVVKDRVKTRLSMFEGPRNGGAQVPMSFKASSSSTADKESLSPTFPVPHILTVNNDSSGAPPPRPKPPVPNKPKVEGVADSDMTRL